MDGDVDLHLTVLFGWLVKTVGFALLVGFGAGLAIGVVGAVLLASPSAVLLGSAVAPVVTAFMLWTADAPMPIESVVRADEDHG